MARVETKQPNQIDIHSDDGRLIATIYTDADNSSVLTLGGKWSDATVLWDNRKTNETVLAARGGKLRIVNELNNKLLAFITPTQAEFGGVDLLREINSLKAQIVNLERELKNKADVNHHH